MNVQIQPTPNPNALKFLTKEKFLDEGNRTLREPSEAEGIKLAQELFDIRGVDQLHFFEKALTVTKFSFEPWESLEPKVIKCLQDLLPNHNPEDLKSKEPVISRDHLSPELQQIEEILDRRIRPGLQGDGGDLSCESFEKNILIIKYQGACGTCPSSTMGTLEAIRGILRDEYDQAIEVYIAPEV